MAARDIRTVIPLPRNMTVTSLYDFAQTWLLHLPGDHYLPVPLRLLKPDNLQRLLLDPQAGIRLDHGAAVRVGDEWFYLFRMTFGLLSSTPIVKTLHVPLPALYSESPISLSELEAALRLLVIAGSRTASSIDSIELTPAAAARVAASTSVAAGFVRKDTVWGWRILFRSDTGESAGSFPLASYARRQHGELAVWEGLRRTAEPRAAGE